MEKVFVKASELNVKNGGYLLGKDDSPVTNVEFVAAQVEAAYLVKLAASCKGKDFKGKEPDSFDAVRLEVLNSFETKATAFVAVPEKMAMPLQNGLAKEALAFMKNTDSIDVAKRVNEKLQGFVILKDFEEFGLFFEPGVVKIEKIYTVKDVTAAVTSLIELL